MAKAPQKKSVVEKILGDVKKSLDGEPAKAVKAARAPKSGSIKSKYEDHPKFSKFKKEGN